MKMELKGNLWGRGRGKGIPMYVGVFFKGLLVVWLVMVTAWEIYEKRLKKIWEAGAR